MTPVPPPPGGSYTPAFGWLKCSRSCFARVSARNFISSLLPKCRQPVGQDLMHAGSSPSLTRSVQTVHLKTRLVFGFIFGMSNGQPVIQKPHPMQLAFWKSPLPFLYRPLAPSHPHP